MSHPTLETLEGRLTAQRALLARLVALSADRDSLMALLEDRSVMRDGQEDPGAVPSDALRIEGALADEYRLLADAVRRQAGASSPVQETRPRPAQEGRQIPLSDPGSQRP